MKKSEVKQIVDAEVSKAVSEMRYHQTMSDILGVSDNAVQKSDAASKPEPTEHYLHGIL